MDICRRLSNEITSLTSATSATEHRRHLQSILDLLEGHGVPSTIDQICATLWGDLGLSLLSVSHRQLSKAFPLSTSSLREEPHACPPYLASSAREKGRKVKAVALSPNDAITIQNIFKYLLDSPHIRLLSSSSPTKDISKYMDEEKSLIRERSFTASHSSPEDRDSSSRKTQSVHCRSYLSTEEDITDDFAACGTNNQRYEKKSPSASSSSFPEKVSFHASSNSSLQHRRRKRIEDIVRSLLSLLTRCARIRLSLPPTDSPPQLPFRRSSILRSSRKLLSGSQLHRISLVVAQQRCELLKKYVPRERKRFSQLKLHDRTGCEPRQREEEEEDPVQQGRKRRAEREATERYEGEWRGQDERWEGCFLTILQQILRNEVYVRALPYDLIRCKKLQGA